MLYHFGTNNKKKDYGKIILFFFLNLYPSWVSQRCDYWYAKSESQKDLEDDKMLSQPKYDSKCRLSEH